MLPSLLDPDGVQVQRLLRCPPGSILGSLEVSQTPDPSGVGSPNRPRSALPIRSLHRVEHS